MSEGGWWAEYDESAREGFRWKPTLQTDGSCHSLDGIWFQTREDCEEFIRSDILGKGMDE